MSQGNQNRSNRSPRSGGGGGGGSQQRRRRGGSRTPQPQAPKGPTMTALGESTYEAVLDHGTAGYGVWFDGMVREDPMYKQFWKGTGNRPMYVRIEENRIVLTKELDRDKLPVVLDDSSKSESASDDDIQAIDLEADAKKAGATADTVYSPEEAARLFASGETPGDSDGEAADAAKTDTADAVAPADEDEAPAKPKRRTTRKKAAPKPEAETDTTSADAGE